MPRFGLQLRFAGSIAYDPEQPMPQSTARKLAAILAADIAGYSALMGADEARTVADLKGHQAVVLPVYVRW